MKNLFFPHLYFMKKAILLLLIALSFQSFAKKHALIIAIGDYQPETFWGKISSANDVPLIKEALTRQGFLNTDIQTITEEKATKKGIEAKLEELYKSVKKGDIVVIHYSGHGQQIVDDNNDEIDRLDEAIVPYDAPGMPIEGKYNGENHIRDDQLGKFILKLRKKIGKKGQLLVMMDSCHSGTGTRGSVKVRGSRGAFGAMGEEINYDEKTVISGYLEKVEDDKLSPFVLISGASPNELNSEHPKLPVGSLSFAFAQVCKKLKPKSSYRNLFAQIEAEMNIIAPNQTPMIEGDVDYQFLNGAYVIQKEYHEVIEVSGYSIKIKGGLTAQLSKGSSVFICPAGEQQPTGDNVITEGLVASSTMLESTIDLDTILPDDNEKKYWAFIKEINYSDNQLNVFKAEGEITDSLEKTLPFINWVELPKEADLKFEKNGIYDKWGAKVPLQNRTNSEFLTAYYQASFYKKLNLKDRGYQFDFKLVPLKKAGENFVVDSSKILKDNTVFKVDTLTEYGLYLENFSNNKFYLSIVCINNSGETYPFGIGSSNTNQTEITPNFRGLLTETTFLFGPPFEKWQIKAFATIHPVRFTDAKTRGDIEAKGESVLRNLFTLRRPVPATRGPRAKRNKRKKSEGYSTEMIIEIVE